MGNILLYRYSNKLQTTTEERQQVWMKNFFAQYISTDNRQYKTDNKQYKTENRQYKTDNKLVEKRVVVNIEI